MVLHIDAQLSRPFIHLYKGCECAPWLCTSQLTHRRDTGMHHCFTLLSHKQRRCLARGATGSPRSPACALLCGTSHTTSLRLGLKIGSRGLTSVGCCEGLWCTLVAKFCTPLYRPRRAFLRQEDGSEHQLQMERPGSQE